MFRGIPGQHGFSLVELLVAMGLGLFVLFAVSQLFVDHLRMERAQLARQDGQQAGRLALRHVADAVRGSGELACPDHESLAIVSGEAGVQGWQSPEVPDSLIDRDVAAEGDVIRVLDARACDADLPLNVWYYLSRRGGDPANPLALFRREDQAASQELVEGVVALRFRYGVEAESGTGYPAQWPRAGDVADWQQVIAIRVWLTVDAGVDAAPLHYRATYALRGGRLL